MNRRDFIGTALAVVAGAASTPLMSAPTPDPFAGTEATQREFREAFLALQDMVARGELSPNEVRVIVEGYEPVTWDQPRLRIALRHPNGGVWRSMNGFDYGPEPIGVLDYPFHKRPVLSWRESDHLFDRSYELRQAY